MNSGEELRDPDPDPALRRALDQWPAPEAQATFRSRLRAEFLAAPFEAGRAGEVDEQDLGPAPIVAPRWGEAAHSGGRSSEPGARPRPVWVKLATIAAIAAAALLIFRWPTSAGWRIAESSDFITARVDGVAFSANERERLASAIVPGSRLEVVGGSLEMTLDRRLALGLGPESVLRFELVPEPGVLDAILLQQERGSLAVVTGPDFSGSSLRVRTPDTEVRVVGTEFAVDVISAEGSCVCCAKGAVQVFDAAGAEDPALEGVASGAVHSGEMGLVSNKHAPVKRGAAVEAHLAPLDALRRIWAGMR